MHTGQQIMFQKFLIRDDVHFVPSKFPQLEAGLQKTKEQLGIYPLAPKIEMILSFVKHHSISSQLVKDYPELATLISSKSLPLHVMEELFEYSKQNHMFRNQLEDHITKYLIVKKPKLYF